MLSAAQSFQAYQGIERYSLLEETAQSANPTWDYRQKVEIQNLEILLVF
jgi:hypothetical protein